MIESKNLEIIRIKNNIVDSLINFFHEIDKDEIKKYFSPHPFSKEFAQYLAGYKGKDLYAVIVFEKKILAYGLLRGWDEGYDTPSLGIIVNPMFHKMGLGVLLMNFLHLNAKLHGSKKIRLRVDKSNISAIELYKKLGYKFESDDGKLLEAFFYL